MLSAFQSNGDPDTDIEDYDFDSILAQLERDGPPTDPTRPHDFDRILSDLQDLEEKLEEEEEEDEEEEEEEEEFSSFELSSRSDTCRRREKLRNENKKHNKMKNNNNNQALTSSNKMAREADERLIAALKELDAVTQELPLRTDSPRHFYSHHVTRCLDLEEVFASRCALPKYPELNCDGGGRGGRGGGGVGGTGEEGGGGDAGSSNSSSCAASCLSSSASSQRHSDEERTMKIYMYTSGGGSKNVCVTSDTRAVDVLKQLHHNPSDFCLVEAIPALYLECLLEDDERLAGVIQTWSFDSENCLLVCRNSEKYDMFVQPQKYFFKTSEQKMARTEERERQDLVREYARSNFVAPDCDGMLYLKVDGRKNWKKYYFVLRPSGLYYCPKGKSRSLMDLVCLQQLYNVRVYSGSHWKKKFKSPTEHCFALKHPKVQKHVPRYIKYFCAEDEATKHLWMNFIRLVKFGQRIYLNFQEINNCRSLIKDKIDCLSTNASPTHRVTHCNENFWSESAREQIQDSFERFTSASVHSFNSKSAHSILFSNNCASKSGEATDKNLHACSTPNKAMERKLPDNEYNVSVKHSTIKRALSSGTRIIKQDTSDSIFPRSCPQSPKVIGGFNKPLNVSQHDLVTNESGLYSFYELHALQANNPKICVPTKNGNSERNGYPKFAMLAGSFKERLKVDKNETSTRNGFKSNVFSGSEKGKPGIRIKFAIDEESGNSRRSGDFDCLPPPPADLLSGFLRTSSKKYLS